MNLSKCSCDGSIRALSDIIIKDKRHSCHFYENGIKFVICRLSSSLVHIKPKKKKLSKEQQSNNFFTSIILIISKSSIQAAVVLKNSKSKI
jgi:hypothetical protein